jgi:hypothetical protein
MNYLQRLVGYSTRMLCSPLLGSVSTVHESRDSSVRIALGYGLDDRGSRVCFPAGDWNFSHHRIQNDSGAHPASYPVGTSDHSPPSSAEVKE